MKSLLVSLLVLGLTTGLTLADTSEGKRLYFESGGYGCVVCHGLVAEGGGQAGGYIRGASLEQLNKSLAENDPMKPLASVLSDDNRAQLVLYLQSLVEIPLVQLRFDSGQWQALAEPLTRGKTAELVAYNASFEAQVLDLTSLGLGTVELPALGSVTQRWQAMSPTFELPNVTTTPVSSFADLTTAPTP